MPTMLQQPSKPPELTDAQILTGVAADLLLSGNHDAYQKLVEISQDPQKLADLLQSAGGSSGPDRSTS